jgi:ComF family protein
MGLLDLFFPAVCVNCRREKRTKLGLCCNCLPQVEFTGLQACIRCGRICRLRECAPHDHRYSRVLSLAHYRGPWRRVVQGAKFARDLSLAKELARELAGLALEAGLALPQAVTPVPSASRHWRNYDIVNLICRDLSRRTGAPVVEALARRPGRPPQVELDRRQRAEGLEDYIYSKIFLPGALVWLVDDVYTTGATADACAGALLAAGARSVYVLVLGS